MPKEKETELKLNTTSRVSNIEEAARLMLEEKQIAEEVRTTHAITGDILRLHTSLKPRWEAFQTYQLWENRGRNGDEPKITDEVTGNVRSARFALAPCAVVNEALTEFVGLTLKTYTAEKCQRVMNMTAQNTDLAEAVKDLRQIAIHAEEAMEQEALSLIFKAVESNPDYKEKIEAIVYNNCNIVTSVPLPNTVEVKTALLKALVVDFPQQCQKADPERYQGMVFKYFDNYPPLVAAELKLLTTPFMQQNADAPYFHKSEEGFTEKNSALQSAIKKIRAGCGTSSEADKAVQHFIEDYPEVFGVQNLSEKVVTFVGAGFPLTGTLLHIQTEGATVNLIDYDEQAAKTAQNFIKITESLGITKPKAFGILHADARDVQYISRKDKDLGSCPLHDISYVGKKKYTIATDVLDLASALPRDVTNQIMQENAKDIPIVRKRNVSGISTLLYEQFNLPDESIFRLAGSVTPPQKVASGASPASMVTGLMDVINVNSDDVYVNTSRFEVKLAHLESLVPSVRVHSGGKIQWNARSLSQSSQQQVGSSHEKSDDSVKSGIPDPHVIEGGSVQWNARTLEYYGKSK